MKSARLKKINFFFYLLIKKRLCIVFNINLKNQFLMTEQDSLKIFKKLNKCRIKDNSKIKRMLSII